MSNRVGLVVLFSGLVAYVGVSPRAGILIVAYCPSVMVSSWRQIGLTARKPIDKQRVLRDRRAAPIKTAPASESLRDRCAESDMLLPRPANFSRAPGALKDLQWSGHGWASFAQVNIQHVVSIALEF